MPTYSYRCTQCGVERDVQQAFTDDALTTCDECGGSLRKLFSPVGVTFSGSGFYRTDSRADKKDTTKTSDAATPATAPAAAPASSSGDSKPSTSATSAPATTATTT